MQDVQNSSAKKQLKMILFWQVKMQLLLFSLQWMLHRNHLNVNRFTAKLDWILDELAVPCLDPHKTQVSREIMTRRWKTTRRLWNMIWKKQNDGTNQCFSLKKIKYCFTVFYHILKKTFTYRCQFYILSGKKCKIPQTRALSKRKKKPTKNRCWTRKGSGSHQK